MRSALAGCIVGLSCLLLLELGSAAIYRVQFGAWYSYSAQQEKARKLAGIDLAAAGREHLEAADSKALRTEGYVLHPYSGFTANPRKGGPYNILGYGGPSPLAPADPRQLVVVLTGGSVAAQLFDYAHHVLEEALERVYERDVVLHVAALGGMKQPQQLTTMAYFLALGAPLDVIINVDGYNEGVLSIEENYSAGIAPVFPRTWHLYTRQGLNLELVTVIARLKTLRDEQVNLASLASAPVGYSVFAGTVWESLNNRKETAIYDLEKALAEFDGGGRQQYVKGPFEHFDDAQALHQHVLDVWANGSRQLAALARGNGIEYYHFLQPNQYLAGSKPLSEKERALLWPEDRYITQVTRRIYPQLVERMAQLASEPGMKAFDLTQVYRDNQETLYVDSCCHLNTRGYEILARAIAGRIARTRAD